MQEYGCRHCSHSRIIYGVDFHRVKKLFVPREMEELEQQSIYNEGREGGLLFRFH